MRNVINLALIYEKPSGHMTSKLRRCDVATSHRRQYDVMCLLGICPRPIILNLAPPQYSKPSYAYVDVFFIVS